MKIHEMLSMNKEFLSRLINAGVKLSDCQYIDLFLSYNEMHESGYKVTYIVASLAEKYQISERKVYAILHRLKQEIPAI